MTEDEAFEAANTHLEELGVSYHRCYHKGSMRDVEMTPAVLENAAVPPGRRRKVWRFCFQFEYEAANTVISRNTFFVDVDDDSQQCSYYL